MKTYPIMKKTTVVAGLLAALSMSAHAQLAHYYDSASGSLLNDQVGTANGTLEGTATISGGALVTDGTAGGLSGGVPANGMFLNSSAVSGITGGFTIVDWFQLVPSTGNHTHLFDFSDGTTANVLIALPVDSNSSPYPSHAYAGVGGHYADDFATSFNNGSGGAWLDTGSLYQMALTYDGSTLSMYVNGALQVSTTISGLNLSTLTTVGVAGGSPWTVSDPSIDGTTYAFDIFNETLSASQVSNVYGLGDGATASAIDNAVAAPEPSILALSAIGGLSVLAWRRRAKR
jgi:hypothetical protein